jgi:hypothetical protein
MVSSADAPASARSVSMPIRMRLLMLEAIAAVDPEHHGAEVEVLHDGFADAHRLIRQHGPSGCPPHAADRATSRTPGYSTV